MSRITAIKLVNSLSKSEKRQFKLLAKKQAGNKDYLDLFDLIDRKEYKGENAIESSFKKLHPNTSIDTTSFYLTRILTDSLIQTRVKEDNLLQLYHGLIRVNIFNERNLFKEGYKELKKLQKIAEASREPFIQFILTRYELNYYSENNFPDISEKTIVETQMKGRNILKSLRNQHEHYSLYEILRYRQSHSGKSLSQKDKDQLNDLMLSEMSLVNARIKSNLESKKLHLLFQSYFFTDIGEYKSALRTFHELNRFFEKNIHILKNPPFDYFSALDGILDSLRTIEQLEEMTFYVEKLNKLNTSEYPAYFRSLVQKTIAIYQMVHYLGNKEEEKAIRYISSLNKKLLTDYRLVDEERQNELLFYLALTYFKIKDYKKANKYIARTMIIAKPDYHSPIYKAINLLSMLLNYENKEYDILDYEIRSYKRSKRKTSKLLKTERLVFKIITKNPNFNNKVKNKMIWKSIAPQIETIKEDKFEMQLLKYFDFTEWIKRKIGQ